MMPKPPMNTVDPFEHLIRDSLAGQSQVRTPDELRHAVARLVADRRIPAASPRGSAPDAPIGLRTTAAWTMTVAAALILIVVLVTLGRPSSGRTDVPAVGANDPGASSPSRGARATFASWAWGLCGDSSVTPDASAIPTDRIHWETQLVEFDAASIELRLDDCTAQARGPFDVDSESANIHVVWEDAGRRQMMAVFVAADDTHWWLDRIGFAPDSVWGPDVLKPLTLTPRGQTYVGDLELTDTTRAPDTGYGVGGLSFGGPDGGPTVARSLTIRDLRLTAFASWPGPIGSVPPRLAWMEDCEVPRFSGNGKRLTLADGSHIGQAKLGSMTPGEAEQLMRSTGTCFVFRHSYDTQRSKGQLEGYGGYWCSAPPGGRINGVSRGRDGEVVLSTRDERLQPAPTSVPLIGWDCPPPASLLGASQTPAP